MLGISVDYWREEHVGSLSESYRGENQGKRVGRRVDRQILYHRRRARATELNHGVGDGKRAPPHRAAANRGGFWLYLRLRNVVWLFLRLGGSEMARPALRGILMTYINP